MSIMKARRSKSLFQNLYSKNIFWLNMNLKLPFIDSFIKQSEKNKSPVFEEMWIEVFWRVSSNKEHRKSHLLPLLKIFLAKMEEVFDALLGLSFSHLGGFQSFGTKKIISLLFSKNIFSWFAKRNPLKVWSSKKQQGFLVQFNFKYFKSDLGLSRINIIVPGRTFSTKLLYMALIWHKHSVTWWNCLSQMKARLL